MNKHNDGDVLGKKIIDYPWRKNLHIYEYIQLKVEAVPDSKLVFMPFEQCHACLDVGGVHRLTNKKNHFYCSFCHTNWYVRYHEEERRLE